MASTENEVLQNFNRLHAPLVDVSLLRTAIDQVVDDRMGLAKEFLGAAKTLVAGSSQNIDLRNGLSRAYYAVHHAARSLALFILQVDPYGHTESLERLNSLLASDTILKGKMSGRPDLVKDLQQLLHERHIADYHPYAASTPKESPLDFSVAAPNATSLADWFVQKTEEFIDYKRANP
jgi:uncharacterized protein (UPF0332 family)